MFFAIGRGEKTWKTVMTKQEERYSLAVFFISAKWRDDMWTGVLGWEGGVLAPVMRGKW